MTRAKLIIVNVRDQERSYRPGDWSPGTPVVLQNSDLHASPNQHPVTDFVMSYSGRVITGLEMRCTAVLGTCSAALGGEGATSPQDSTH